MRCDKTFLLGTQDQFLVRAKINMNLFNFDLYILPKIG
jgi:hypothetical protein